ncbi:hypothetical protein BCR32DRAFT_269745 [Anaeromyces robustus]|uniref:Uncharacterized protein n=1 Tax=Anaeromyces robustus TaxID=1754192 RepID=A0A1Y1WZY3_9FUNG|nr:hypothetical protein BCR32DRAFT_269745 [Anaeromyces robustus]|eukprot:ORX78992.1 hypothetical protein BCR32DRAFT_269745 [Anaeromyces robustus]
MSENTAKKANVNLNEVNIKNESHILMDKKIKIKEETNINIKKEKEHNYSKIEHENKLTDKKHLEQIERRKLLEEYKKKKKEKKNSVQKNNSSKINLKRIKAVKHEYNVSSSDNNTKTNLKNHEIVKIKKEVNEPEIITDNNINNSFVKSIKKEIDIGTSGSTLKSNTTNIISENRSIKINNKNLNKITKRKDNSNQISSKLISNANFDKKSKSINNLKNIQIDDKNCEANTTVIFKTSNNKNKKNENLSTNLSSNKSPKTTEKSFLIPLNNKEFQRNKKKISSNVQSATLTSKIEQSKDIISLKKCLSHNISRSQSDLSSQSYLPSTPKSNSKTIILSSPLISSPVSSPTINVEIETKLSKPLSNFKKFNSSYKLSEFKANQSFCVGNTSKKRSRSLNISNEHSIDAKRNIIKKIKLSKEGKTNINNKSNNIVDPNIISSLKEDNINLPSPVSVTDIKYKKNQKNDEITGPLKHINTNETKSQEEKLVKKKNGLYPHYLMPTANWKTKIIKPVTEKKINSVNKLSPISKAKSTLKVLNISKTIKKKTNNTVKPIISTSSVSKINTNKTNTIVTSNMTSIKQNSYTHNNSKINLTPVTSKIKMVSSCSNKDNNKDRPYNGILSRSATLPISTPSKRINKNIKRNNIAFTEENEQDINRMFISAETLKSSSIDSFFSHYNSTETEKKESSDKKVNKKPVTNSLKKLEMKNENIQINTLIEGKNDKKNTEKPGIKNKISNKDHDGQKIDDTPFSSENSKPINFVNTKFNNHQELINNSDIPKENLLLTEKNINDKILGQKMDNKNILKESNLKNNVKAEDTTLLKDAKTLVTVPCSDNTNVNNKSLDSYFINNSKTKNVEDKNKNIHENEKNKSLYKEEDHNLMDINTLKQNENILETCIDSHNSSFITKIEKSINSLRDPNFLDKINLKDNIKVNEFIPKDTHSNSIIFEEIEEMPSIGETNNNEVNDIKDISFKIKNIESLVDGTTVKVNKIIEDYQDDSFIVDDSKSHRLNASFTVSNLSEIDNSMTEIIKDHQERPYHSFIIDTNSNSFISRLANTSQFIEEEKSNEFIYQGQGKTNNNMNSINNINSLLNYFIEHCSFVLSKREGKQKKGNQKHTSLKNTPENKHKKLIDHISNSSVTPKSSSKKKKSHKKKQIYKNEIIKTPRAEDQEIPSSNHLPIVGGDVDGYGSSVMILTPIRAKKKDREEFGVSSVVTPVRRSLRNIQKKMSNSSSHKKPYKPFSINDIKIKVEDEDNTYLNTPVPTKLYSSSTSIDLKGKTKSLSPSLENKEIGKEGKENINYDKKDILSSPYSDYEDLFKPSNKFEAIEEILEKHDYAFIPNKAIKIENFDFPNNINYTPKKEIKHNDDDDGDDDDDKSDEEDEEEEENEENEEINEK